MKTSLLSIWLCLLGFGLCAQSTKFLPGTCQFVTTGSTKFVAPASGGGSIPQTGSLIMQYDDSTLSGSDNTAITAWSSVVGPAMGGTANIRTGANGLNSRPIVQFDGSTQGFTNTYSGNPPQPFTVCVIYKYLATSGNLVLFCDDGSTLLWITGGALQMYSGTGINIGTPDTSWHKEIFVFNGASSTYAIDGAAPVTLSGSPGTAAYLNKLYLAQYTSGGFKANVDMAAVYVWTVGLSSGEQTQMSSYINGRWGL